MRGGGLPGEARLIGTLFPVRQTKPLQKRWRANPPPPLRSGSSSLRLEEWFRQRLLCGEWIISPIGRTLAAQRTTPPMRSIGGAERMRGGGLPGEARLIGTSSSGSSD